MYDQWFLGDHSAGPSVADVLVTPLGTAPTFTQAVTAVDDDWTGTPTWIVQKFAWHVRPAS